MIVFHTKNLGASYGGTPVLENINVEITQGSLCGIIGPNGAGKSTFLKAAMDFVPGKVGTAEFFGQSLNAVRQQVAFVPQSSSVDWDFPTDVFDVVLMGTYGKLGWFRSPGKKEKKLALECLEKVGMQDFMHRQIGQLSGGQRQRVFLARALAQEADLYFLDEPFAGVDAATEKAIMKVLKDLQKEGKTIVAVHHDLTSAAEYFDHLLLMNKTLIASGKFQETFTEKNLEKTYGHPMHFFCHLFQGER